MKKKNAKTNRSQSRVPAKGQASVTSDVLAPASGEAAASAPLDPKWEPYRSKLLELRERLMGARSRHRQEGEGGSEVRHTHLADNGSAEYDQDLALSELSANQNALYEIEDALRRMANGTYGLCEETGKPISKERLRAIPWTRYSREAELRLERTQTRGRTLGQLESTQAPPK